MIGGTNPEWWEEFKIIRNMLDLARSHDVELEVIHSFAHELLRQAHEPQDGGIERAAMNALDRWDLY